MTNEHDIFVTSLRVCPFSKKYFGSVKQRESRHHNAFCHFLRVMDTKYTLTKMDAFLYYTKFYEIFG